MNNTVIRAPGQEGRKRRTLGLEHLGKRLGKNTGVRAPGQEGRKEHWG